MGLCCINSQKSDFSSPKQNQMFLVIQGSTGHLPDHEHKTPPMQKTNHCQDHKSSLEMWRAGLQVRNPITCEAGGSSVPPAQLAVQAKPPASVSQMENAPFATLLPLFLAHG